MPEEKNTNGYTHQLSISQLNEWSDMGKVYKEELTKLFGATLVVTVSGKHTPFNERRYSAFFRI